MGDWITPLIGLAGTVFGGAGLAAFQHFLGRGKVKNDMATELRDELREDLKRIRANLDEEAKESEQWREKYWELKYGQLMTNYKVDKTAEVVDGVHPDKHLKEDLDGIGC